MDQLDVNVPLGDLAPNYKALLCDAWGVIHNGVTLFDGAGEALRQWRKTRGPVMILTNAPRPSDIIPAQLKRLGLPDDAYDGVVTSGDAVRAQIMQRLDSPIFRLGPDKDDPLYADLAITFTSMEEARYIVCTGLFDELGETPEDYIELLQKGVGRNIEMICANPDIVVRWGDKLIYCAGALAKIYEELGGTVIHGGKPHAPIYDLAMTRLIQLDGSLNTSDILAIGDGLQTDILGANLHNIDVAYVHGGGGIHQAAQSGEEQTIASILHDNGVHAVAGMETLKW